MPSISENMMGLWRNYHLTECGRYRPLRESDPDFHHVLNQGDYPDGSVRDCARIDCSDVAGEPGPELFAATAATLRTYLCGVLSPPSLLVPKRKAADLVPIGRGWSFSALVGAADAQLDCTGLSGFAMAREEDMAPGASERAERTAFVLGGTRLRELLNWAQKRHGLSIMTSGTHLGLTVAGAIATSSHGSRLGFGGMQNLVTGLHLVTGPLRSVWIERRSRPVLDDAAVAAFATEPPIRDDAVFEDALVHLGGMGIVNGVTLAMTEDVGYALSLSREAIDADWLADIAAGNWRAIAARLGLGADPLFYELTIDPANWSGNPAVHNIYLPGEEAAFLPDGPVTPRSFADLSGGILAAYAADRDRFHSGGLKGAWPLPSTFALYCQALEASELYQHPPRNAPWNALHADEITGGYPGALYNASFAVRREEIGEVIPLICDAVKGLDPTFLFTMRFVSQPAGTLAFTRFPENCVIEIDGFSANAPVFGPAFGRVIAEGARRVRACLDGGNASGRRFEYGMHWGKLGGLDKAKVWGDFGAPGTPGSRIDRWRATRARLLDPALARVLWNKALIDYGLIDQPQPPADDEVHPCRAAAPSGGEG